MDRVARIGNSIFLLLATGFLYYGSFVEKRLFMAILALFGIGMAMDMIFKGRKEPKWAMAIFLIIVVLTIAYFFIMAFAFNANF